jgi:hypothetical protein
VASMLRSGIGPCTGRLAVSAGVTIFIPSYPKQHAANWQGLPGILKLGPAFR